MALPPTVVLGELITPAWGNAVVTELTALPSRYAPIGLGVIQWRTQTAAQSGIAAEADITNLGTLSWTATPGRLYRITLHLGNIIKAGTADGVTAKITDNANSVTAAAQAVLIVGEQTTMNVVELVSGLSGAILRKARIAAGSGTVTVNRLAVQTTVFYVEDVGPA